MVLPPLIPVVKPTERRIELNDHRFCGDASITEVTVQGSWYLNHLQNHDPLARYADQYCLCSIGVAYHHIKRMNSERRVALHMLFIGIQQVIPIDGVRYYEHLVLPDVETFAVIEIYILYFIDLVVESVDIVYIIFDKHLSDEYIFVILADNF